MTKTIAKPAPKPVNTINALQSTLKEIAEREADSAAARLADIETAWALYVEILERSETPQADDVDSLLDLMRELGISKEQVTTDRNIIRKFRTLEARYGARDELAAKYREAVTAHTELKKKNEEAEREAYLKKNSAHGDMSEAALAETEIRGLFKLRPQLFVGDSRTIPFPWLRSAPQ